MLYYTEFVLASHVEPKRPSVVFFFLALSLHLDMCRLLAETPIKYCKLQCSCFNC
ncbi:unnamed protein product, partial [Ixodes pacificus]